MLTLDDLRRRVDEGQTDTVLLTFTDLYGRQLGKRLDARFFLESAAEQGTHACDYLLTVDMNMEPVPGYRLVERIGRGGYSEVWRASGPDGNVALKLSEGLIETFTAMLRQELEKTLAAKVGYIFSEKAFRAFRRRLDYSEYGGAPLLGLKGITIVCHGRSNVNAIKNAIRVANDFCKHNVNRAIETEFNKLGITRTAGVT